MARWVVRVLGIGGRMSDAGVIWTVSVAGMCKSSGWMDVIGRGINRSGGVSWLHASLGEWSGRMVVVWSR